MYPEEDITEYVAAQQQPEEVVPQEVQVGRIWGGEMGQHQVGWKGGNTWPNEH